MWDWSSTEITFDQTCWAFDGSNNCAFTGGGSDEYKYASFKDLYDDKLGIDTKRNRILMDDAEIAEFINIVLSKNLI